MMKNRHGIYYYLCLSIVASCLYINMTICIANTDTSQDSAQQTEEIKRPDFILQDMDGNLRDVSEWDGKVLIIVFGATWVGPVHAIMNMLNQLQEKYNDHGVQIIFISVNDPEGTMSDFLKEFNLNFPTLILDENTWQNIAKLYGVFGLPHAVFVDRHGFIRNRLIGSFTTTEEIEAYIRELI